MNCSICGHGQPDSPLWLIIMTRQWNGRYGAVVIDDKGYFVESYHDQEDKIISRIEEAAHRAAVNCHFHWR